MHKRSMIASIGILLPILASYAQTAEDALLFSNISTNGTARFQGMGGVQTALGADISSITGNPAGLGFFRKSEWSISPSIGFSGTRSNYLDNTTSDGKSYVNIANMGIVFANPKDDIIGGKWRGGSFGISFNRMNSYQNQFSYQGVNNVNSITDSFTDRARGIPLSDFEDDLAPARLQAAYLTYLINPFTNDINEDRYYSSIADVDGGPAPVRQRETVNYTGAQYRWNLAYGGNYDDKLYFGASLGISRIRYGIQSRYRENVLDNPDNMILSNFTLHEDIDVRGTGINLSAGIIYRPNDIIRFGASFTSPTWYRLTDNYAPRIQATYEYTESLGANIPLNMDESITDIEPFQYNLTTPLSVSGGLALFAGKNGFVTADVTYSTFNTMRFSSETDDFQGENDFISRNYQSTVNVRLGGEYRIDVFRLRAGAGYQADPYKEMVDDLDRSRLNFSAGAGIRLPNFYVDLAVVHSRFNTGYTPYTISTQATPSAIVKNRLTNAVLSFGMFF